MRSTSRFWGSAILGVGLVALALAFSVDAGAGKKKKDRSRPRAEAPVSREDLQVVDCLLPGQMRKLGRQQTYISRRRPVRTTGLDCGIRGGEYVSYDRANYETALAVWLESAELGDEQAQYYVGEIYQRGLGRDPDYAEAAEWYRKAAEQGHEQAQINLGFLYEKGLGVEPDARAAMEWYRLASGVSGVIMLDSEVEAIQQELADVNARLAAAEASAESLSADLDRSRKQLRDARASGEQATAELTRRVADLERKLETENAQIAQYRGTRDAYNIAGPTIEIIDPTKVRAPSRSEPRVENLIFGRVEAPAGLAELKIDGAPHEVQDNGSFRFRPGASRTTIVAIDTQGKRAERVYDPDAVHEVIGATRRTAARLGDFHALVIGNGNYPTLPNLETAESDVAAIADVLESRYGFRVRLLRNATYIDMLSAFRDLREELEAKDNLVVYYAGHGEYDSARDLGYWLPVDADREARTNWISSLQVSQQLSLLPSRHVLVIADSCYSGALTRSSLARIDGSSPKLRASQMADLASRRSRTALTSGGLKPVLDAGGGGHSIFARSLLDALSETSDSLETYRLWSIVKARVMLETRSLPREQIPEYAPIQYAGHEGGEFFFVPVQG